MKPVFEHRMKVVSVIFILMASIFLMQSSASIGTRAPAIPDDYHPGIIRVSATYPNSTPAVSHDVKVFPSGKTTLLSTNCTDSSGFAELKVNFGDLGHLSVYLSQYMVNLDKEHITLGPDDILSLEMTANKPPEPEVYIVGTVRDALTEAPIGDINLTLEGSDHYGNEWNGYYLTKSNGTFAFWVPISDQPYEISYLDDILYLSYYADVFTGTTPGTIEHDIYLYPTYQPDNPFSVRFVDADSGDPYADGYFEISGYTLALDHGYFNLNFNTNNSDDGWYESYLNHGEYSFYWLEDIEEYDITLESWSYFYVNYTEVSMEITIDPPNWKLIEVEVWNYSSPLQEAYVGYSTRLASDISVATANSWNFTDADGRTYLYVPDNEITLVEVYGYYGGFTSVEIDPTAGPGPIKANVTLETIEEPPVIEGDVKITVRDRITDAKVPYASLRMYYSEPDFSTLFYTSADINGEYNGKARAGHYRTVEALCKFGEGHIDDLEVTASGTTDVTIYVDRYPGLPEVNQVHFYLKDETGNPVPDQMMRLDYKIGNEFFYLTLVSDENGKVSFWAPPVEFNLNMVYIGSTYRPKWTLPVKKWYAPEGGGQMDDVIVYPTTPMEEIWGFVKEKDTGLPVQGAFTIAQAFKLLEDVEDDFDPFGYIPEMPEKSIPLSWVGAGSVADGYYRFWGRDTTFVYCSAEGYFPIIDRIELNTRADHRYDFLMEEIPPFDIYINGTLVNEEDEPIEGWIEVQDLHHDLYLVGGAETGPTGEFSIPAYPGIFRIMFGNATVQDRMEIEVTEGGVQGLILKLVPKAMVSGVVTNWNGTILGGVNVTIQRIVDDEHNLVDCQLTDEMGGFAYRIPAGDYRLIVEATELYDKYLGEPFTADGWNDLEMNVRLENRTSGMLEGYVLGEGGPFAAGIPEAVVVLSNFLGPLFEVFTNESGFFSFGSIPYGMDYRLNATPPDWLVFMDGVRPGYLWNITQNVTVNGPVVVTEILLAYQDFEEVEWLDIVEVSPEGDNVPLEAPLVIVFSDPVNRTILKEGLSITPPVTGIDFTYHQEGSIVIVSHDPFAPNTTYRVIIEGCVLSENGVPLREYAPYSWEFTTGEGDQTVLVFDVILEVTEVKDVHFSVIGKMDLTIFAVIDDAGSFAIPSVAPGIYETLVPGSNFLWDTTYSYHLSDTEGGEDIAPEFSGTFTTPEEPEEPPLWELYTAEIIVDEDMNWEITATGASGMEVYLVVIDVGSLYLEETEPGEYIGTFGGDRFVWGMTYSYHFSNETDGMDLAPSLSGSRTMPGKEIDDDEDDDDVGDFLQGGRLFTILCCGAVLIIVIIIALLVFVISSGKGKKGRDLEE